MAIEIHKYISPTGWHVGCVYDPRQKVWRVVEIVWSDRLFAHNRTKRIEVIFGVLYVPAPVDSVAQLNKSIGYACSPRRMLGV